MTGEVKLDTLDIWTTYGTFLPTGSFNELMKQPKRKESLSNNWRELDGIEIDLSSPKFEARDVDLSMIMSAPDESTWWTRHNAFFTVLKSAGTHALLVTELNKTYQFFYREMGSFEQLTKIKGVGQVAARFTVKLTITSEQVNA